MTTYQPHDSVTDPQERLRREAIESVLAGQSQSNVARRLGVTRQAVSKWMKSYRRDGPAGLVTKKRGRRRRSEQPV